MQCVCIRVVSGRCVFDCMTYPNIQCCSMGFECVLIISKYFLLMLAMIVNVMGLYLCAFCGNPLDYG